MTVCDPIDETTGDAVLDHDIVPLIDKVFSCVTLDDSVDELDLERDGLEEVTGLELNNTEACVAL